VTKGPEVQLEVRGQTKAAFDLRELGVRASDVRPVGKQVRSVFHHAEEQRFADAGPGWPPLAASTAERKSQQDLPAAILRASDRLYRSLVEGSSDEAKWMTPTTIELGTKVWYARFHQDGTVNLPQRIVVDLPQQAVSEISGILARFIAKAEP
jgi:phage gpG-like protein